MITSHIPGRVRLRDKRLRDTEIATELVKRIRAVPGVTEVVANSMTGSVLIHYDVATVDQGQAQALLASLSLHTSPNAETQGGRRTGPSDRRVPQQLNLGVKLGMLATLLPSLWWAAAGRKGLHKQFGGLFTLMALGHMYIHRQRLLK